MESRVYDLLSQVTRDLPYRHGKYTFHCAPDVFMVLRQQPEWVQPNSYPPMEPPPMLGYAEVIVRSEFDHGIWELRRDDIVIKYGRLSDAEETRSES